MLSNKPLEEHKAYITDEDLYLSGMEFKNTATSMPGIATITDEKGNTISFVQPQSFIPTRLRKDNDTVYMEFEQKDEDGKAHLVQHKIPFEDIKNLVVAVFNN